MLIGVILQVPALLVLLNGVFDMHNRFSTLLSILLPYAAIGDRLTHPSMALMWGVVVVTALQYPLYGAVVGSSWAKGRLVPAVAAVAGIHGLASCLAIYMKFST